MRNHLRVRTNERTADRQNQFASLRSTPTPAAAHSMTRDVLPFDIVSGRCAIIVADMDDDTVGTGGATDVRRIAAAVRRRRR